MPLCSHVSLGLCVQLLTCTCHTPAIYQRTNKIGCITFSYHFGSLTINNKCHQSQLLCFVLRSPCIVGYVVFIMKLSKCIRCEKRVRLKEEDDTREASATGVLICVQKWLQDSLSHASNTISAGKCTVYQCPRLAHNRKNQFGRALRACTPVLGRQPSRSRCTRRAVCWHPLPSQPRTD